ncbi:LacI family DNA-binding transcriptional regulator [Planococcus lenghuensis]|uniref:LacI family transcriptional regulator n=1 Tax=Planococcus lenghuensis TaxID=2213202 RepID=A0A1Q2L301_9BACL|nr:LacI family DNA-binding transcriptional regulator [Planococcus lenghuensis]AQQ54820.1 LacI family transcriptional regulator [Planococcus lenghuensis]
MTTIKDVAKQAGVSVSVVSKTFNNYADVKEATRQKIFAVAKELNYTPNISAKNLSSKKQTTVGLISSGILNDNEKDNNAFDTLKGVYKAISKSQFELSIYLTDSQEQQQKSYAQYCRERNIGGAILQGIRTDDPYYKELISSDVPCVVLDIMQETDNGLIGSVSIDNAQAAREMASYLLTCNHRDITIMAGTAETYVNKDRLRGVRMAFLEHGAALREENILYAEFSEQLAYEMTKRHLTTHRPTAFLCFSDLMAFGVMKAAQEAGLRIPEDVSITGFDDLMISNYIQPGLTTVGQNFAEIGKTAAQLLLKLMDQTTERQHIYVPHQLVKRGSVRLIGQPVNRKEEVLNGTAAESVYIRP